MMVRKLIIVCDDKTRQYGDFLSQLISLDDDIEGEIVGVRDGSVSAQVWLEKDFEVNSHLMSSDQFMLFIGNSKLAKDKRLHMQVKFSEYGMEYGWLGKQASLCVTDSLNMEEYTKFVEYAKNFSSDIKQLVDKKELAEIVPVEEDLEANLKAKIKGSLKGMSKAVANASARGANSLNMLTNNKKIEEQQYSCAVLLFYLNGLSEFLRISDE